MDDNKFFKFIWRMNALILVVLLLFAGIILFWELLAKDIFGPRRAVDVVNIDHSDTSVDETRSVIVEGRAAGAKLFRVSLTAEQDYDLGFSSKSTKGSVLNTGFHDPYAGGIEWVFPTQEQLITYVETVFVTPKTPDAKGTPLAVGHLITFVDQDTSGDKRLSPTDSMSVLAIGPDGENAKVILSGLTTTPRIRTLDGSSVVLFFETAKGAHSVVYDLAQGTLGTVFPLAQP